MPFDDPPPEMIPTDAIAWLRFLEDDDGKAVRGALFQTSVQGEPLDFCFSRIDGYESDRRGRSGGSTLARLVRFLFQSTPQSPKLVLTLADEAQAGTFAAVLHPLTPVCGVGEAYPPANRVRESDDAINRHLELRWSTEPLGRDSEASCLLIKLAALPDPLEPFARAAAALAEAFSDERVHAMTAVSGLDTVVSLRSLEERPAHTITLSSLQPSETARTLVAPGAIRQRSRVPRTESTANDRFGRERSDMLQLGRVLEPVSTLAERLWSILAVPKNDDQDIQLKWSGELMPFQQEGVRALLDNDRLLLADDMGLGKTVQAIAALRILRARRRIGSCLITAPASLLDQWRRELEKWAPELSAIIIRGTASDRKWQWNAERDVTLVSYDTLRSDFSGNAESTASNRNWDVVVADEAQRIKNRNDTSNVLKALSTTRSWALTGTPIENHEEELASILEFVDYDRNEALKRYRPGVELQRRHRELQVRRKKAEVLDDLPPKRVTKITMVLASRQRTSYDRAEHEGIVYLKSLGAEVSVRHVLELITRLKQICNADPRTGESSKLVDIRQRMEQLVAQGHKALVFSQYVSEASGVGAAVRYLEDFNPLTITGGVPQHERAGIIERFKTRNEHKVLVLSLRTGGLGLNLQEASYVFHLDRWWNPAVERQAEDRSHRLGQTVKVNVIKYSCTGTIEERIDRILESKQELFDELVDDVSLDLSTRMNREELLGLFGLGDRGPRA